MPVQLNIIHCGDVEINIDLMTVRRRGKTTKIKPKDMEVLRCLVNADGRLVSRKMILDNVWPDVVVNPEAVSLSISRIRAAFGESAKSPKCIHTIPTKGYRFVSQTSKRQFNRKNAAIIGLIAAFVLMTLMFLTVRSEYESITSAESNPVQVDRP